MAWDLERIPFSSMRIKTECQAKPIPPDSISTSLMESMFIALEASYVLIHHQEVCFDGVPFKVNNLIDSVLHPHYVCVIFVRKSQKRIYFYFTHVS